MLMNEKINTIKNWVGTGSINIFGLPFAGKDTQGEKLAEMLDGVMLSSGDILRHDHGNEEIQRIMAEGGLIPVHLFEEVVVPYIAREEFEGKPLILSEVGRMQGEQIAVMHATESSSHHTKAVVLLKMSDEEVWRRFDASQQDHDRGERADDNKAVLQNRLDNYHQKVWPVIEWYKDKGLLIEIDGSLSREGVTEAMIDALYEKATS